MTKKAVASWFERTSTWAMLLWLAIALYTVVGLTCAVLGELSWETFSMVFGALIAAVGAPKVKNLLQARRKPED